jgi:hypothetical protein
MQTVAETQSFISSAKAEGMTAEEIRAVIDTVAETPDAGELIVGSGGCRKVRIPGKGKGKSGGYRVVTVFGGGHMPVYLVAVLAKGSRSNFSKAEVAEMAKVAKRLIDAHRIRKAS